MAAQTQGSRPASRLLRWIFVFYLVIQVALLGDPPLDGPLLWAASHHTGRCSIALGLAMWALASGHLVSGSKGGESGS